MKACAGARIDTGIGTVPNLTREYSDRPKRPKHGVDEHVLETVASAPEGGDVDSCHTRGPLVESSHMDGSSGEAPSPVGCSSTTGQAGGLSAPMQGVVSTGATQAISTEGDGGLRDAARNSTGDAVTAGDGSAAWRRVSGHNLHIPRQALRDVLLRALPAGTVVWDSPLSRYSVLCETDVTAVDRGDDDAFLIDSFACVGDGEIILPHAPDPDAGQAAQIVEQACINNNHFASRDGICTKDLDMILLLDVSLTWVYCSHSGCAAAFARSLRRSNLLFDHIPMLHSYTTIRRATSTCACVL